MTYTVRFVPNGSDINPRWKYEVIDQAGNAIEAGTLEDCLNSAAERADIDANTPHSTGCLCPDC